MFFNPCCFLNLLSSLSLQAPPQEKLPVLYLVDSIVKNVGGEYLAVFAKNLITSFICVFEKVQFSLLLLYIYFNSLTCSRPVDSLFLSCPVNKSMQKFNLIL